MVQPLGQLRASTLFSSVETGASSVETGAAITEAVLAARAIIMARNFIVIFVVCFSEKRELVGFFLYILDLDEFRRCVCMCDDLDNGGISRSLYRPIQRLENWFISTDTTSLSYVA